MKKILAFVAALSLTATTAFSGDLSEPVLTEVEEPAAGSSVGSSPWLLLLGAALIAVVASDDD